MISRAAQADNPRTGTTVFQTSDRSMTYLEMLVGCQEIDFEPLALDLNREILQILGGTA